MTNDFEKACDSINHSLLIAILKKCGFGENFLLDSIKILTNQESCVINGDHTTKYFKLEQGARQGDLISKFLFILALEKFFIVIKSNKNIFCLNIFDYGYSYTAYADDTFFSKTNELNKKMFQMTKIHFPNSLNLTQIKLSTKLQEYVP